MNLRMSLAAALFVASPATAEILVHRDPGCGCCEKWAAQLRAQFKDTVKLVDDAQRPVFQKQHGVPAELRSCHTAIVGGYVFEGHVPFADMKRLIAQRPKGVTGLAVAGMPMGSPGMEVAGLNAQHYDVIAFGPAGRRVFARH